MEVSCSYALSLFRKLPSPHKQAVPSEVGKPVAAHVAAEAIQEKIQRLIHGVSPSCFFMVEESSFKRSLNLSHQCQRKESHSPLGTKTLRLER